MSEPGKINLAEFLAVGRGGAGLTLTSDELIAFGEAVEAAHRWVYAPDGPDPVNAWKALGAALSVFSFEEPS